MKFIKTVGDYRIYALDERECKQHHRLYPTLVCWEEKLGTLNPDIGDMSMTENESETIEEMVEWCKKYS